MTDDRDHTTVQIENGDGQTETLTVTRIKEREARTEDGDDYSAWIIEGVHPEDTQLIPSRFTWHSGSQADPRDLGDGKFPLVYIPKDSEITVRVRSVDLILCGGCENYTLLEDAKAAGRQDGSDIDDPHCPRCGTRVGYEETTVETFTPRTTDGDSP